MSDRQDFERWREHIAPFLESKREEFFLLGVENVTTDELWLFVLESLRKKKVEGPIHLHEFVSHVMGLSVNDYMNKIRLDMYQGMDLQKGSQPLK